MLQWDEWWLAILGFASVAIVAGLAAVPVRLISSPFRMWFSLQRMRRVRWTGWEVFFAFVLLLFIPGLVSGLLEGLGFFRALPIQKPTEARRQLWASPLTLVIIMALLLNVVHARTGTRPHHVGLTLSNWTTNLVRGILAFLVLTPLVLAMYALTVVVFGTSGDHPLRKLLGEDLLVLEWGLWVFQAVIWAPIAEEFVFRGLLLGWLRRASWTGHAVMMTVTLAFAASAAFRWNEDHWDFSPAPLVFALLLIIGYGSLLYCLYRPSQPNQGLQTHPPDIRDLNGDESPRSQSIAPVPESQPRPRSNDYAWLSVSGSAMFFAVSHSQVWPSPVALFLLGLGLGWLAFRTQSLIGPIVCHSLFNAVACVIAFLEIWLF